MDTSTMSKSAFARHIGVTPARVTQYIQEGTIDGSALIGEGRTAKIKVDIAERLVAERRDPTQAMANGTADVDADDDLFGEDRAPSTGANAPQPSAKSSQRASLDIDLKQQKLLREQRANIRAARQDAIEDGRLVDAAVVGSEVKKAVTRTMQMYEGAIPEIARNFSASFEVPQRDAEHLLRKVINSIRERESKKEALRAEALPDVQEVVLIDETIQ
jgi:hypothetical protein